jgi:putative acetyltransferase
MSQEWIIRKETSDDYDSIDAVIAAASGEQEAVDLVRRLRREGDALLSLVAEVKSRILGHIMMSRMLIDTGDGVIMAVTLAPLMVDPAYQNQGVGTQLTQEALDQCRDMSESIVSYWVIPLTIRVSGSHPSWESIFKCLSN